MLKNYLFAGLPNELYESHDLCNRLRRSQSHSLPTHAALVLNW